VEIVNDGDGTDRLQLLITLTSAEGNDGAAKSKRRPDGA
jgi:hypothetical protein